MLYGLLYLLGPGNARLDKSATSALMEHWRHSGGCTLHAQAQTRTELLYFHFVTCK